MPLQTFSHQYEIGDLVYLNLPEGGPGRIIDISFNVSTEQVSYFVMFGIEFTGWYIDTQLSKTKIII